MPRPRGNNSSSRQGEACLAPTDYSISEYLHLCELYVSAVNSVAAESVVATSLILLLEVSALFTIHSLSVQKISA